VELWWLAMLFIEVEVKKAIAILPVATQDAGDIDNMKAIHEILLNLNDLTF
jgi:hypothetical protein